MMQPTIDVVDGTAGGYICPSCGMWVNSNTLHICGGSYGYGSGVVIPREDYVHPTDAALIAAIEALTVEIVRLREAFNDRTP